MCYVWTCLKSARTVIAVRAFHLAAPAGGGQDGGGVGIPGLRRQGAEHVGVAGALQVALRRAEHQSHQGIEPVDRCRQEQEGFVPDVPAAEVGELVEKDEGEDLSLRRRVGEEHRGPEEPRHHGT